MALLQGNIPQDEKFEGGTGIPIALDWYGQQLQQSTAELVVLPETAIPVLPQQLPAGYFEALLARFSSGKQAALVGIPLGSASEGYTNSVIGLKPGAQQLYRFDKHHLVPFGEFIPPLFRWFTQMMNIPLGDFNRGPLGQRPFEWQGQRLAPNICYEDLFGEELAAPFADPRTAPTIFVNVSNIGWFGNTVAIDQHLQISRMRAIEFERPDDPRHQHRRHGDHRPPRAGRERAAPPHPWRADGRSRRPQRHHGVCVVGVAPRAVARVGPGFGDRRRGPGVAAARRARRRTRKISGFPRAAPC